MPRMITADVLEALTQIHDRTVQTCITSPPYWSLRYYDIPPTKWPAVTYSPLPGLPAIVNIPEWVGCLGLEPTPEMFVGHLVEVFRGVHRTLRKDGTLWLNIGDTYATRAGKTNGPGWGRGSKGGTHNPAGMTQPSRMPIPGLKRKDLCGIPWRTLFALQADGWYFRRDIIWHKPTCMPESAKDRPTTDHEYVFLLSKSPKYYFDNEAIKEIASPESHARYARGRSQNHKYADGGPGQQTLMMNYDHMRGIPGVTPKAVLGWAQGAGQHSVLEHAVGERKKNDTGVGWGRLSDLRPEVTQPGRGRIKNNPSFANAVKGTVDMRNKRSVWSIMSEPCHDAHFATFPQKLVEPMILAGAPTGSVVLDPFSGKGTTCVVAKKLGRDYIGIDSNPSYMKIAKRDLYEVGPLFAEATQA
jgi:DNA modification methylase